MQVPRECIRSSLDRIAIFDLIDRLPKYQLKLTISPAMLRRLNSFFPNNCNFPDGSWVIDSISSMSNTRHLYSVALYAHLSFIIERILFRAPPSYFCRPLCLIDGVVSSQSSVINFVKDNAKRWSNLKRKALFIFCLVKWSLEFPIDTFKLI